MESPVALYASRLTVVHCMCYSAEYVRICLVDHTTVEESCHSALQHNNTGILAILEASRCIRLSANSPACLQQLGFQAASPPFTLARTHQSDATVWERPYYCKNERYCERGYSAVGGMDSHWAFNWRDSSCNFEKEFMLNIFHPCSIASVLIVIVMYAQTLCMHVR